MTTFDTSLLPPREEAPPPRPLRPVWRTTLIEAGLLVAGSAVLLIGAPLVGFAPQADARKLVSALFALAPLGLWLAISYRQERRAAQPRPALIAALVVGLLVANALVAPFIELFIEPERWLNSLGALPRMAGYGITVGVATEVGKYLVLRYVVWPRRLERRIDIVAYSIAVSLAFATVFNLRFALLDGGALPGTMAARVTSVTLMQEGIGLVVAHRLMTLRFNSPSLLALPLSLVLGSLMHGVYIAFRAGFVVQSFGIGADANSPLMGFAFSVAIGLIFFAVYAFLIQTADLREVRQPGRVEP
jgi:RsiW-degrading membrane proteinase PrsW (M82 family)